MYDDDECHSNVSPAAKASNSARLVANAAWTTFLGEEVDCWFKEMILLFLFVNLILRFAVGKEAASWAVLAEFILTLACSLTCYPLFSGGLLALEAVFIGLASPRLVEEEIARNLNVILLITFMVTGVTFLQDFLLIVFSKLVLKVHSRTTLCLAFALTSGVLSMFLDGLTVVAVVITVALGFKAAVEGSLMVTLSSACSGDCFHQIQTPPSMQRELNEGSNADEEFRSFLQCLVMHAAVGASMGGMLTNVGEPQNLVVAAATDWDFQTYLFRMAPVTIPAVFCGFLTLAIVEKFGLFGYGAPLPPHAWRLLRDADNIATSQRTANDYARMIVQAIICALLVVGLALQVAHPGTLGIAVLILATALGGSADEQRMGKAFTQSMPFAALLTVFFTIIAVVKQQKLFRPVVEALLKTKSTMQLFLFYGCAAALSVVSDNTFVATLYVSEAKDAWVLDGVIDGPQFNLVAAATAAGVNMPSLATPGAQPGLLFLLTSTLAPPLHLSYLRMMWMTLPFTVVLLGMGALGVTVFLEPVTSWALRQGVIQA